MFEKLRESLAKKKGAITPQKGDRLERSETQGGETILTITGQRFPGFFIIFGLMFGGIPFIILLGILFGTPDPENGPGTTLFTIFFLSPFLFSGASFFLIGLFLWLGRTDIHIGSDSISIRRILFRKTFQTKEFTRADLSLSFKESHESNNVPSYKLTFTNQKPPNKIGVGGSLREAELLWLEREVREVIGEEITAHPSVIEAMNEGATDEITAAVIDPDYHSKTLSFSKTTTGWEAKTRTSTFGAIALMLFGSIFLIAGLMMGTTTREFLLNLIPPIQEALADSSSSGESPPIWFSLIFAITGLAVMLSGLFLLGYRATLSKRHSRLHRERRCFVFVLSDVYQVSDLTDLDVKRSGHVNNDPRFSLTARFKHGKKAKILRFATADDVGQLHAKLSAEISAQV